MDASLNMALTRACRLTALVVCMVLSLGGCIDFREVVPDEGTQEQGPTSQGVSGNTEALLGSDISGPPGASVRNSLVTYPMNSVLLTPDGRLGITINDVPNNRTATLTALGDPQLAIGTGSESGIPSFQTPMASTVLTIPAPSFEGMPGKVATLFQNSGAGALVFDPRFSPTGRPVPVRDLYKCTLMTSANRDLNTDQNGTIDCYKLIHFQPVALTGGAIALHQADLTVVVDARRPSTTIGVTGRAATPKILTASYNGYFNRSKVVGDVNNVSYLHALETSVTADGRMFVAQGAYWAFNETPWASASWSAQRKITTMYDDVRNDVGGLNKICRRYNVNDRLNCTAAEEEPLARVYPLAQQPFYRADGSRLPGGTGFDNCGYVWISPEGTDLFCRPTNDDFGLDLPAGFESSTGMHFFSVGQHTGWVLRRIDGGPNIRRFNPDKLIGNGDELRGAQRPFNLLFFNTSTGFWAENRRSPSQSLPILRQWPLFQFFVQANALTQGGDSKAMYTAQGLIPYGPYSDQIMQYHEVSFACGVSPNCLLHLQMNELMYDAANPAALRAKPFIHDASNNTNFFTGGVPRAAINPHVPTLVGDAKFAGEVYGPAVDERYLAGFRGTTVAFGASGAASLSATAGVDTVPCGRNKGCLVGERYDAGFTAELAFLPLFAPSAGSVNLGVHHGLWSLSLQSGRLQAVVNYTTSAGQPGSVTLNESVSVFSSTPQANLRDQARLWTHVALRVSPRENVAQLYVNGALRISSALPAGARFSGTQLANGEMLRVGPAGTCTNCPATAALFIDEVEFHKSALPVETIAATAGTQVQRSDFLSPADARALLAGYFSATNPNNLSLASDGFPRFVRPEDLRIPYTFVEFLGTGGAAKFRQLVAAGQALFTSPVLSTNAAGVSQVRSGTTELLSCASCHDPLKAFTDGRVKAVGVQPLDLNAPTIINRALGTNQFFDRRATSIVEQALLPVQDPRELNGNLPKILERINNAADQASLRAVLFNAFGSSPVTSVQLGKALASYQLVQLSVDSLSEAVVAGGEPVRDPQGGLIRPELVAKGKDLFEGKARCIACHTGPNLSDELPHDTGVTTNALGAFKTPTLWNVAKTGPYFHDGSRATLRQVLDFYNNGRDPNMPDSLPNGALRAIDPEMRPLGLNDAELTALETYLRFLQNTGNTAAAGSLGLSYSTRGAIPGLYCTGITEGADPADWGDNHLCAGTNYGLAYSSAGEFAGMECEAITEGAEPAATTWTDNYLCVPRGSSLRLDWSEHGRIKGKECVAVHEPTDPQQTQWMDNYICYDAPLRVEFSSKGPIEGMVCSFAGEPQDVAHGWADNYICTNKDIGLGFSSQGVIANKRCVRIYEDMEPAANGWGDNYLCVDSNTEAVFAWTQSEAAKPRSQACVKFDEPNDPLTWADNSLCWNEPEVIIGDVEANIAYSYSFGPRNGLTAKNAPSWNTCPFGYTFVGNQFSVDGFWLCARNDLAGHTFHVGDVTNNVSNFYQVAGGTTTSLYSPGSRGWNYCESTSTYLGNKYDSNGFWACMKSELPQGFIDSAGRTQVCGWAIDPDFRTESIDVQVYIDGAYAGHAFTDSLRPDVNSVWGTTGNHGYCIPYTMTPGTHSVVAYGVDLDGKGTAQLANSNWIVQ